MIEVPTDLMNFLRNGEQTAVDATRDGQIAAALDFYNGEPFGDEEEGRSQIVTRDVAEVVDHMTVSILKTMVSGDKVVEFEDGDGEEEEPQQEGQEAPDTGQGANRITAGQEATAAVAYQFMRKQRGYFILHDALKAGLLEKSGVVKTYAEPQRPKRVEMEVPVEALAMLEMVAAEPIDEAEAMWRVVVEEPQAPLFRDDAVPNEEFRVSPDARTLDEASYLAHITRKSLSTLAMMGFDAALVERAWSDSPQSQISNARDSGRSTTSDHATGAHRVIWLREEYVLWDINGDGIAERLCIHRVGDLVLGMEEVDEQPFSLWCPFPMQHRLIGQSLADKVMDIQRVNSVLTRQGFDSLYQSNAPRTLIHEDAMGDNTIDDLLTVRPGALIRWKGSVPPTQYKTESTAGQAFQAVEFMIAQREARTGITRHNQGLNPDTLNKTASGMAMLQASGDQIQEYVARNFAEALVSQMFAKRYRLMKKFGQPFRMKIDGRFVTIDPQAWPDEMDMAINVGLGSGRKDQRIQYRTMVLGVQKEAMAAGLPIVKPEHIYNSARGLIADASLGNVNDYFADPATIQDTGEDKPDPEMARVQVDAALRGEKLNAETAETERRTSMDQQKLDADLERIRFRDEQEIALKRARAEEEAQLAIDKQDREERLAMRQQDIEAGLAARAVALNVAGGDGSEIGTYRPGGDLAA